MAYREAHREGPVHGLEDLTMDKRKYDEPEAQEDTKARAIAILALALAVVLGLVLVATGAIQIS